MKANPRIDLEALPPGPLWWISRCAIKPDVVITFTDVIVPTWHFARQRAEIMWRLEVTQANRDKDPIRLEKYIQEVLSHVTTSLWITTDLATG